MTAASRALRTRRHAIRSDSNGVILTACGRILYRPVWLAFDTAVGSFAARADTLGMVGPCLHCYIGRGQRAVSTTQETDDEDNHN